MQIRQNWEEHIDRMRAKAKAKIALNSIKAVAGKKQGTDRKTIERTYSTICRSMMDYGC